MNRIRSDNMRRIFAGLLVLAVLVMSFDQSVAMSFASPASFGVTHHDATHDATLTLTAPHHAVYGAPGVPCRHDGASHRHACCSAGDCTMLSHWLPAATQAQLPAVSRALARGDAAAAAPDGTRASPEVPPPRRTV